MIFEKCHQGAPHMKIPKYLTIKLQRVIHNIDIPSLTEIGQVIREEYQFKEFSKIATKGRHMRKFRNISSLRCRGSPIVLTYQV